VFAAEMAIWTPLTIAPGKKPARILGPNANPRRRGVKMTYIKYILRDNQEQSFL
jgi:hypothetical protein